MKARLYREREAKVAMISSIARSQDALAGILENIAEITAHSDVTARKLAENIRLLNAYQSVMAEMLTGIRLNRSKLGKPASPWLKPECSAYRNDDMLEERNLGVLEDLV
ncbi:hypothetical protein SAMN05661091_4673 [Paenibacillus uliginis N3/975]|uniref:Uncharacterized protein n=1 Tax=Paenibacillus uliginis N3/975 TaxID=1313296 RepID=A0A1X7HMP1_9BACL|nr:hypothetical protein [Paenibacillus uliginis]SMF89508.1 hypothetical protein SAMN05661091_4673 [Paenibacillus uliginis N3/975]